MTRRAGAGTALALAACAVLAPAPAAAQGLVEFRIVDGAIPAPLTAQRGDAARGRTIVANRQVGLCLLCHSGPFPEERFQGNVATDLAGTGSRWSEAQLRLRMVDSRKFNPDTPMPSYYRVDGLSSVAPAFRGKPIFDAQQIEDVVAFLLTLK